MTEYQVIEADETVYRDGTIKLHGEAGFEGMRKAGRLAAEILDELTDFVQPGVTTGAIDDKARTMMLDAGAVPATMGYRGYTHSCCTSINHVICHGIPSDKALKEGDIVNIDVTPLLDGWHGDTSRMFFAGEPSIKARRLVDVTYECLMLGIEAAGPRGACRNRSGNEAGHVLHYRTDDQWRPPACQDPARWLDGGHARQVAFGAVRTLDRDHRRRGRNLYREPQGPAQAAVLGLARCA